MFSVLVIFLTLSPADIELVEGGEVMDVDTIPIQLIENNGFEMEKGPDNPWVECDSLGGNGKEANNHKEYQPSLSPEAFEGDYYGWGETRGPGVNPESEVYLIQNLKGKIIMKDLDSLEASIIWKEIQEIDRHNFSIEIGTSEESIIAYNFLNPDSSTENRYVINMGNLPSEQWVEQVMRDIGDIAEENGIGEEECSYIKFCVRGSQDQFTRNIGEKAGIDEIYLWAHEIETGIEEQPAQRLITALELQSGSIVLSCAVPASTPYTLSIFDVSGREVYSRTDNVSGSGQITCSPMSLSEGVYFWKVATDAGDGAGKFVWVR